MAEVQAGQRWLLLSPCLPCWIGCEGDAASPGSLASPSASPAAANALQTSGDRSPLVGRPSPPELPLPEWPRSRRARRPRR